MPHYKLYYFDHRANGEVSRLIFAAAGVEFEDVRVSREQWKRLKPADLIGLLGKTPWEEALVDSIVYQQQDFYLEIEQFLEVWAGNQDGDKDQIYKDIVVPSRDRFYGFMTHFLDQVMGEGLTMADIYIAEMTCSMSEAFPDWTNGFPKIQEHERKVMAQPGIAKWIAIRQPDHDAVFFSILYVCSPDSTTHQ